MRRGALVGDAYVRIHADSSAVDDELRREFATAGKKNAREYISNFDAAIKREARARLRGANQELVKGIVGGKKEWDRQFKNSGLASVEEFAQDVRRRMKRIAAATDGRGFTKLQESLDGLDEWAQHHIALREMQKVQEAMEKIGATSETRRAGLRGFFNEFRDGRKHVERFSDIIGRSFGRGSRNNFLNFTGNVAGSLARISGLLVHGGFSALGGLFKVGQTGATGFYKILQGIGQLMSGGGSGGIVTAVQDLGSEFAALGKQFGTVLIGALRGGLPTLLAVGAALVALAAAIPPILALVGALAGIFTALAASISIGLVGALLAAAPLLVALVAGFTAVTISVIGLQNATSKINKNLAPLRESWRKTMKVLQGPVLEKLTKNLAKFAPLVDRYVTPGLEAIGTAAGRVAGDLADALNSDKMKPFLKAWTSTIPRIFENLGKALNDFTTGLIAFFTPILPFAERLSEKIGEIAQQFSDWASSTEGQNSIADFMKTAWDRASDLWNILVLVAQAIGAIFSAGDETAGGSFLDTIQEKLQTLVDWLNSPEGATAIREFFSNAADTASTLWQAISNIAQALRTINWKEASDTANTALTVISELLAGITVALGVVQGKFSFMSIVIGLVGSAFQSVYNAAIGPVISKILGGFSGILRFIATMLHALGSVTGWSWPDELASQLQDAAGDADALGDAILGIPDGNVNINIGLTGPGANLVNARARRWAFTERGAIGGILRAAAGSILTNPTMVRRNVLAGEAGREAIVPLDRPLALVDPSVRELAAFAQGRMAMAGGGMLGGGGTTIAAGAIQVVVPNADPFNVAEAVLDRIVIAAR